MQNKYVVNLEIDTLMLSEDMCSALITDMFDISNLTQYHVIHDLTLLNKKSPKVFGKARIIELVDCNKNESTNLEIGLEVLDSLDDTTVLFVRGSNNFAYFGELMGLFCATKNVKSVIVDGRTRDSFSFKNYNYPILAKGTTPLDIKSRGKIEQSGKTLYGSYCFKDGDLIYCDSDACVLFDESSLLLVADKLQREIEKEKEIKRRIIDGKSLSEIVKNTKPL